MNLKFLRKKKEDNSKRRSIRGVVRCECKKHKCERFSTYRDYRCDDCFHGKLKCHEDQLGTD